MVGHTRNKNKDGSIFIICSSNNKIATSEMVGFDDLKNYRIIILSRVIQQPLTQMILNIHKVLFLNSTIDFRGLFKVRNVIGCINHDIKMGICSRLFIRLSYYWSLLRELNPHYLAWFQNTALHKKYLWNRKWFSTKCKSRYCE